MTPIDALLRDALRQAPRPVLWVVDEQVEVHTVLPLNTDGIMVLGNRIDTVQAARDAGLHAVFSDMQFRDAGSGWRSIVYRISKEKAVVHRIINQAADTLPEGGQLWLIGGKQEGIRTYADKASHVVGMMIRQENGGSSTRAVTLARDPRCQDRLDDKDYSTLRSITEIRGRAVFSKPGQFGWDKCDEGSALLTRHLPPRSGRVLDLGCGYGYLTLHISNNSPRAMTCTDNNAAAIASCRYNVEQWGLPDVTVVADDCASQVNGPFDTVICNPPFHQGFATRDTLTERFVAASARVLAPEGAALFVVNQFIPLEACAETSFHHIETLEKTRSFKVLRLSRPR